MLGFISGIKNFINHKLYLTQHAFHHKNVELGKGYDLTFYAFSQLLSQISMSENLKTKNYQTVSV